MPGHGPVCASVLVEKRRVDRHRAVAKRGGRDGVEAARDELPAQFRDLSQQTACRERTSGPVMNRASDDGWSCEAQEESTAFCGYGVSLQLKPSAPKVPVIVQVATVPQLSIGLPARADVADSAVPPNLTSWQ